jgi:hypothetical protein
MSGSGGFAAELLHQPHYSFRVELCCFILYLTGANSGLAMEIPPTGWSQHFDSEKNAQVLQPDDSRSDILIKYYPKVLLEHQDISDWLLNKLSKSKAPRGEWTGEAKVVRDTANLAQGFGLKAAFCTTKINHQRFSRE